MTSNNQTHSDLTHAVDPDGRAVVGVSLSNRPKVAWLYLTDYVRITAEYGTPKWYEGGNGKGHLYVRFRQLGASDRKISVARLVAGDFVKTGVRYLDGNPLNLRNANLIHDKGRGGRPSRTSGWASLKIPTTQGAARG